MSTSKRIETGPAAAARPLLESRRPPPKLGRYTIFHEVGSGGMATVYLARIEGAAGFEKLVALKTIHKHLARESTFVEMFLDEARIASKINHPNVCTVFDFGAEDNTYYLAMEYLVGEPLIRIVNAIVSGRRTEDLGTLPYYAARIIADAAEGLHAAHELHAPDGSSLGIVHRDVSPQNLFITYDGAVKVVDFGCAKAIERVSQTDAGTLKGKVSYAAPEQIKTLPVDRRADVWSLGVCLWEALTLKQLFRRDTDIRTAMAVLEDPIPHASEGREWVPEELAAIVERALERDPEKRFPTARAFSRELRAFIARSGQPVEKAELADWLGRLVPEERAEHLRIVEQAQASPISEVAEVPRPSLRFAPEDTSPHRKGGVGGLFKTVVVVLVIAAIGLAAWAYQTGQLEAWIGGTPAEATPEPTEPVEPDEIPPEVAMEAEVAPEPTMDVAPEPTMRGDEERPSQRNSSEMDEPSMTEMSEMTDMTETGPSLGSLRVEANGGWAEVYNEGRLLGRTPLTTQLPEGEHQLRLLPSGREPGTNHFVRVHAGTEVRLNVAVRGETEPVDPPPDTPMSDPIVPMTEPGMSDTPADPPPADFPP
jgi:eukaryotic-like serine/threonine-protein kinase